MAVNAFAVGSHAVATKEVAGRAQYGTPVVTITSPTSEQVLTTGGPNLTVTWSYSQPESQPQKSYQVFVSDDAGVVSYQTGWIDSTNQSHVLNLRDAGIIDDSGSGDSTDVSVEVWVRAEGVGAIGESGLRPFQLEWGVITITIDDPVDMAVVTTSSLNFDWTFSSTRSKTQQSWRAQLRSTSTGVLLEDSGWTAGTDVTYTFAYSLSDGSSYDIDLSVRNSEGVEKAAATVTVTASIESATAFTDEATVGTRYEVGVNGKGYMLFDNREGRFGDYQYERRTVPLVGERFVTSETPFSQSIDRYQFATLFNWAGGAGQRFADREDSDSFAFFSNRDVAPKRFDPNALTPTPTVIENDNTFADMIATVVDDTVVAYDNNTTEAQLADKTTVAGAYGTAYDVSSTVTVSDVFDLTSDGQSWFAACGSDGIFTAAPGSSDTAAWLSEVAKKIDFLAERLIIAVPSSGTESDPANRVKTISNFTTPAVEYTLITLPATYDVIGFAQVGGYTYFAAKAGNLGVIYAWNTGVDPATEAPFVAYQFPAGETPVSIFGYQGQLFVMSQLASSVGAFPQIWRMVSDQQNGTLTPFLVASNTGSLTGGFAALGPLVAFAWDPAFHEGHTEYGVGLIDLSTGGYYSFLRADDTTGSISSLFVLQASIGFIVQGAGSRNSSISTGRTGGYLQTSLYDGGTTLDKAWESIYVEGEAMVANGSWGIEYSVDGGVTFVALTDATNDTVGQSSVEAVIGKSAPSLQLRIKIDGAASVFPEIHLVQVKYYLLGSADELLVLPIDCGDSVSDLEGRALPDNGPGKGAGRARALQELVQTRCSVQDIDYQETLTAETFTLESVSVQKWSLKDRSRGVQGVRQVAVCTFRRPQK